MSRISNLIELFIKELMEDANNEVVEIQRNELANYFNCAPSQINYVLTTRFSIDKGYIIDSRRGGGGYIRIVKIHMDKNKYMKLLLEEVGSAVTQMKAETIIHKLLERNMITEREHRIMLSAVSDKVIHTAPSIKDELRASLLKNMLITLLRDEG